MHRYAFLVLALVGCSANPAPRPCRSAAPCVAGESCVVGACGGAPVAASNKRYVLQPDEMAFVFDKDDEGERVAAPFGSSIGARARLLVRFPLLELAGHIERAFLVLDRAEGAQSGPSDVTLRADAITEPWSVAGGAGTGWTTPPKTEPIVTASTIAAPRGAGSIRIDVTSWAERLLKKGPRPWGLRVEGLGDGYGVPIATGAGNGVAPRLELYVLP